MNESQLTRVIEALIFASETPVTLNQLKKLINYSNEKEILDAIQRLENEVEDHSFYLKKVAGGYLFSTRSDYSRWISQLYESRARSRLSRAALEALSIIAFKQPVSKVEVSAIRGVNSNGVIKSLLERKIITIKTDNFSLICGGLIQLTEHPVDEFNRNYHIVELSHHAEQRANKIRYYNVCKLTPSNQVFVLDYFMPDNRHIILQGKIEGHPDDYSSVDSKGRYKVNFYFDSKKHTLFAYDIRKLNLYGGAARQTPYGINLS